MRLIAKRIYFIILCLLGAIGMFLLGVMTERRWAANRTQSDDQLHIEELIADSAGQEEQPTIDISELDFPERLREGHQASDVRSLTPDHSGENTSEENSGAINPREASVQLAMQNHPRISTEVNRALYIQLGAFGNRANAKKAVSIFSGRGFHANIIKRNDATNGLPFKVRMGPFENHNAASVITKKLKQQNIPHFIIHPSTR